MRLPLQNGYNVPAHACEDYGAQLDDTTKQLWRDFGYPNVVTPKIKKTMLVEALDHAEEHLARGLVVREDQRAKQSIEYGPIGQWLYDHIATITSEFQSSSSSGLYALTHSSTTRS